MGNNIFRVRNILVLSLAVMLTIMSMPAARPASAQSTPVPAANEEKTTESIKTDESRISVETSEVIEKPELKIVVNLPAYTLSLIEGDRVVKTFPVAIAAPRYATPVGKFSASHLIWNPSWTPPDSPWAANERAYAPGESGNPLGRAKIRLGGPYLIHGGGDTSVGRAASHGCIRMRNADVLELARLIIAARELKISEEQLTKLENTKNKQFGLKIDPAISVEISYRSLTVENRQVEIHPDVYRRGTNTIDRLKDALVNAGFRYEELSMEEQLTLVRALRDSAQKRQVVELGSGNGTEITQLAR